MSLTRVSLTRATAFTGLTALTVGAALWSTIAYGFYRFMHADLLLIVGATGFFAVAALAIAAYAVRLIDVVRHGPQALEAGPRGLRWVLALSVPVNIIAMSFGCGFPGCTPLCMALTAGSVLMGAVALREALRGDAAPLLLLLALAYAIPHCTCANPINIGWIRAVGVSPDCFAFPVLGTAFAALGLRGVWPRLSTLLAAGPALAAAAFAFGHHVLHYPW